MNKDNYYKYALGMSGILVGLSIYNTFKSNKNASILERNNLSGIGEIDQTGLMNDINAVPTIIENEIIDETQAVTSLSSNSESSVDAVSQVADKYFDSTYNKIDMLLKNESVQSQLKGMGISLSANSLNKERLKNIMAAFGVISLMMMVKGNLLKTAVIGGGFVLLTKNKDKIEMALNSISGDTDTTSLT